MKIFRICVTALLIGWMIFIFSLSAATATESSATSGGVIKFVAKLIYSDFSELSAQEQREIVSSMQFFVRKAAHFTLYAILGGLAFLSIVTYVSLPLWLRTAIGAGICLIYAISDEIHQLFVDGRSGEFRDVCIDFSGSLLAILFLLLFLRCKKIKNILNGRV